MCGAAADWGVSAHTDFELFSLLHELSPGLELQSPDGEWHRPEHGPSSSEDDSSCWVLIVGDMLERLSGGYFVATPHRVTTTDIGANAPRRSLVYFQGLDEEEAVEAVHVQVARRSTTGGYRRWCEEEVGGSRSQYTPAVTQREWTELKESAARDRLRERTADTNV